MKTRKPQANGSPASAPKADGSESKKNGNPDSQATLLDPLSQQNDSLSIIQPQRDALTVLRTETALSRFPLHRLTKNRTVQIEVQNQASAVLWRVDHNSRYGQPGALAYKIDSLYINRCIEESGRPIPKVIRLGSLREIAAEVGSGTNTTPVKQALLQNATASITAKISYRTQEGGEQWLEAIFSRYSIVFTGEKLPQGGVADAVYLVLNDIYQQILNTAVFRPLDYDYMKSLPPIAQRFYEIVSYQVYAAQRFNNPRAKVMYSEYCLLSTAIRYPDFEHVKKQMYKMLKPHIQSGYLRKVEYEATTNEKGEPDWILYLTPGINAAREFRAFTGQGKIRKPPKRGAQRKASARVETETLSLPFPDATESEASSGAEGHGHNNTPGQQDKAQERRAGDEEILYQTTDANARPDERPIEQGERQIDALIKDLIAADLNRSDAVSLAREKPEVCRRQLEFLPYVEKFKTSRGAYLRRAIEEDFGPTAAHSQAMEKQTQERAAHARRALERLQATEQKAREGHEEAHRAAFAAFTIHWLNELEETRPEAFLAFTRYESEKRVALVRSPLADRPMFRHSIENFDEDEMRADRLAEFCREEGKRFQLQSPTFWQWDAEYNSAPFQPELLQP